MSMSNASNYGNLYWCVKTTMSKDGEIYLHADSVRFTPTGDVVFSNAPNPAKGDTEPTPMLALASGHWTALYAASTLDGHAVAVEHWKGEAVEAKEGSTKRDRAAKRRQALLH
jgi:hypothetical protein